MRIFTQQEKQFIQEHKEQDTSSLMLQASRYPQLPVLELVQQIQALQKASAKLPTWASHPDIVFPAILSVEQTSSEATAAYKASLVSGKLLIDLTGGFGVDSFFFSKSFEKVIHVEQQSELSEIAAHNFRVLQADNVEAINTTAEAFLQQFEGKADVIFLDPARRSEQNQKLHFLQDCEPDVLQLLPLLFSKADAVLLKTSPMLDIDLAINQLQQVAKVWVVAVQNECKEVLYLLQSKPSETVEQVAINLLPNATSQVLRFNREEEESIKPAFSDPQEYIYEPNAAILKAGAYKAVGEAYNLNKLHPNSHLYTSDNFVEGFPGRSFRCLDTCRYSKKEMLRRLPQKKANITVRNFPDTVATIRKKTGIKEGGDTYLFFTTDMHQQPIVLICQKVILN
ncbi:THUMP-like domain-containing protein [Pontibacter harenae]|uniref:THUMP-like domain-containing protein n=1 Tax=Pontibacter harenae TaxID=2894083 RepID=UPI001E54E672|nr:RsmD family RNA methyltransferase [Pontibacter harenae]MCC9165833.1 class I SAM-dependent methyltransferase [Pontibacter harenae]